MKKIITIILTIALVFSLAVPAFAEEEPYRYVALGDSSTNGFGLDGFVYVHQGYGNVIKDAYIWQFADYLEQQLGRTVDFKNLALCAMRPSELAYFLDESISYDDLDAYGRGNYGSYTDGAYPSREALNETYIDAVSKADLITYDLGVNNFGNYMLSRVTGIFGIDIGFGREGFYDDHFNDLMAKNNIDISIETRNAITSLVENVTKGALTEDMLAEMIDAVLYSYASFVIGFRDSVARIYELNPDVRLIVFGLTNSLKGMTIKYNNAVINLGALWGGLMDLCNMYIIDVNEHRSQYSFADLSGGVETVLQAIAQGKMYPDLCRDLLNLFYSDMMFEDVGAQQLMGYLAYGDDSHMISKADALAAYVSEAETPEKAAVNSVVNTFIKAAADDEPLDMAEGIPYVQNGLQGLSEVFRPAFLDYDSANGLSKSATKLILNMLENGTGAHPSVYGHQQKLAAVKSAYNSSITADGTHLVRFVNTAMNSILKIFKSPDWLQSLRELIHDFFRSILPVSFI